MRFNKVLVSGSDLKKQVSAIKTSTDMSAKINYTKYQNAFLKQTAV